MNIHLPDEQLSVPEIELGAYEHYKGNRYEVIGVGLHSETNEPVVIYRSINASKVPFWVRPYKMFIETVLIGGKKIPRFKKINNE